MTTDGLNEMKLEYNFLNLTGQAKDMSNQVKATYTWLADGTKAGVKDATGQNGFEYTGSLIYSLNNGVRTLEGASFGGGRIRGNGEVHYFLTDHLGSTRVILNDANRQLVEQNDYYPFGTRWEEGNSQVSDNRFRFTGHEDQTLLDRKYMDAGARFLSKKLPVWNSPEPLYAKYYSIGSYVYCAGNPVSLIDPNGEDVYLNYYTWGNTKNDQPDLKADAMFWASAITRGLDMVKDGTMKDGDIFVTRRVSDMGALADAVQSDVAKYSPQYGKTAEFNLWSHGALEGPTGSVNTSGDYRIDNNQMSPEGWGKIDFNWKDEGAKATFYGCRTASSVDDHGIAITPWAKTISENPNMHNVEVSGQTTRSWPSTDPNNVITPAGDGSYPTYMVGAGQQKGGIDGVYRHFGISYHVYPMAKFINGVQYFTK